MKFNDLLKLVDASCYLVGILIVCLIVGFCFDYSLATIVGQDVPWYADASGGVLTMVIIAPVAFVCFILVQSGVEAPFFDI